ncbi:MAG: hypothetical protein ABL889_22195, partial [Terricaulis sp.]
MRRLAVILAFGLSACATQAQVTPVAAESLGGAWTVDLSTDPAEPYTKPMVLTLNADGTVSGSFYESDI